MGMVMNRFEVWLTRLDPSLGKEIRKTRPCVIISPNDMNRFLNTVIIAPMTTRIKEYPSRVKCRFKGKNGEIALDQMRTVDKIRLIRKDGIINEDIQIQVLETLQEIFS